MTTAILQRIRTGDQGTLGELTAGAFRCSTLEPPWRDNARGVSCLPPGTFPAVWHQSPRFGWVYKLLNTAPRAEVLIHPGNYAGDRLKGYRTDSQGCILPGMSVGTLLGPLGAQLAVLDSRGAVDALVAHFRREPFTLEIRAPQR